MVSASVQRRNVIVNLVGKVLTVPFKLVHVKPTPAMVMGLAVMGSVIVMSVSLVRDVR